MTFDEHVFAIPISTEPEPTPAQESAVLDPRSPDDLTREDRKAAEVLIRHLFAPPRSHIEGVEYHAAYALAEGAVGGDIVDVYHFDNGSVAFSIADISGKGSAAAIHAALVKYGLRCYTSEGLTVERVLRSLDRAYIENNAFERTESFASVFHAIVDRERQDMTYASAGHEPVFLCRPSRSVEILPPSAPLIGVFEDQNHLFKQHHVRIEPGTVLFAATDGVTEARNTNREWFGMDRLKASVARAVQRATSMEGLIESVMEDVTTFTGGRLADDIAMLAVRFY